jgi:hypothetical protein
LHSFVHENGNLIPGDAHMWLIDINPALIDHDELIPQAAKVAIQEVCQVPNKNCKVKVHGGVTLPTGFGNQYSALFE